MGHKGQEPSQCVWQLLRPLTGAGHQPPGMNEGNDMKVTVYGAGGGEVTGSAYLLQTGEANVLVDFGLFQGARKVGNYNRLPKKGAFNKLDAVVLTHAHLDHTGRLPL